MRLRDLLSYEKIVIQCHDNPDADAIGSGFGLYTFFKGRGKDVSLIYSGKNRIKKSNLTKMVNLLEIPIQYVTTPFECDLLLIVDGQYGEGNVTRFEAPAVAVIDHHMVSKELPELSEVRSYLGACATLVWSMLHDEGFDANLNTPVTTALYYGLYMDTGAMAELSHPMDRDLRDQANFDSHIMTVLRNSNLSIEELEIAGTALLRTDLMEEYHCAIVKANQCDPNILGIISDMVLEVDMVDVCVVFTQQDNGVKFSVRSCVREVMADELAFELAKDIGSGGGHVTKAGGYIRYDLLVPRYEAYCVSTHSQPRYEEREDGRLVPVASACKLLFETRIKNYFDNTMVVDASDFSIEDMDFQKYRARKVAYGFVESTELFPLGTRVRIRSIDEEDLILTVQEQMVFLIGAKGDVNAVSRSYLEEHFRTTTWTFELLSTEYVPTIRVDVEGSVANSLLTQAKVCIPNGEEIVTALQLEQNIKLFDLWDDKAYKKGEAGDYLMLRNEFSRDLIIMNRELFENRYELQDIEKPEIDAVVFDLDGTLLNTLDDLADAVNAGLRAVGEAERSVSEVQRFVGNGVRNLMIRSVQQGEDDPHLEEAFAAFKEYYSKHNQDKTAPYTGIVGLFKELKERGIKIAVVSNKYDAAVKELCDTYFGIYVMSAIGDREGMARKPAPDSVFEALKELDVAPEHAIYVGDSDVDIETANNAGMKCISVSWGFKSRSFLEENGATEIIDIPSELLKYI